MSVQNHRLIDRYFPVLDNGFIALKDFMGDDNAVVQAARVSYGVGTKKVSEDRGLIRYLKAHKHTTPFEMVEFKFHMAMPILVARQWIRHRTASVNEYSGRYSLMPQMFYTPTLENFATQSLKNRQGRSEQHLTPEQKEHWDIELGKHRANATQLYVGLLGDDVAKELARMDMPLSMYTYWYWKIDLHNLMHFLSLRMDSHAQYEIRVYANIIGGMLKEIVPDSWGAFVDYVLMAKTFSRGDLKMLSWYHSMLRGDSAWHLNEHNTHIAEQYGTQECGFSKREFIAFWDKILMPAEVPDYTLSLDQSKDSGYYEQAIQDACEGLPQ
jgi:thymidylate synthase (FAD)